MQRLLAKWIPALVPLTMASAAPQGFPESGNGLWYASPGAIWSRDYLPLGNGYLGAMTPGGTNLEILQLNIESLWTGGPFEDPTYNGGNKQPDEQTYIAESMARYQETIFQDGVIEGISDLGVPPGAFGSYAGAGYFISTLDTQGPVSDYVRWLNLDEGVARTTWTQNDKSYTRTTFCSYDSGACTQHLNSSAKLPEVSFSFSSHLEKDLPKANVTCLDPTALSVRGLVGDPGMLYQFIFKAFTSEGGDISCNEHGQQNATVTVKADSAAQVWVSWYGDTEYDISAGDELHGYSFKGPDPHDELVGKVSAISEASYDEQYAAHVADINATLWDRFSLDLGQKPDLETPTDQLIADYTIDGGNVYIEWLLFNYGRYLLASSARGVLPANLQGVWADGHSNAFNGDYHANINTQMNYWVAESTGLDVVKPLFDYMQKNWIPRGEYTATVLYNASRGWVTHNEMNIFGHTGMKEGASAYANYPESGPWMMFHVWDHFDFTGDVAWFKEQGWPLLKGAALFQLDKLLEDRHFKTIRWLWHLVAPRNKTCAHSQQVIWQLFNAIVKGYEVAADGDSSFLQEVIDKRARIDKGIHIGQGFGQLQEWKVENDNSSDTHRHLSHLVGLYPGYAIASYDPATTNYTKAEVLDATRISLEHRGNGSGSDADAGWEKVWRAACWAQLADEEEFYHELKYSIKRNIGANLFSLFDPDEEVPIFQIEANLGYPAAVLNAIIQTPDVADNETPFEITLLPALPPAWNTGSIRGVRARKGVSLDLSWKNGELTDVQAYVDQNSGRQVNLIYRGEVIGTFIATTGYRTDNLLANKGMIGEVTKVRRRGGHRHGPARRHHGSFVSRIFD